MFPLKLIQLIAIVLVTGLTSFCSSSEKQSDQLREGLNNQTATSTASSKNGFSNSDYKKHCGLCHPTYDPKKYSRSDWEKHVHRMMDRTTLDKSQTIKIIALWDKRKSTNGSFTFDDYKKRCLMCHPAYEPDKYSKEDWAIHVKRMAERAKLTKEEVEQIIQLHK